VLNTYFNVRKFYHYVRLWASTGSPSDKEEHHPQADNHRKERNHHHDHDYSYKKHPVKENDHDDGDKDEVKGECHAASCWFGGSAT
jgi:hypothetical protein